MKPLPIILLLSGALAFGQSNENQSSRRSVRTSGNVVIDSGINEGSGLIFWDGMLWTHNDSGKPVLYALDPKSAQIVKEISIPKSVNTDWEDLAHDSSHIYIADTGNNLGLRDTLEIIKVDKLSLHKGIPKTERIRFYWNDPSNPDCEALIIKNDSIYLFTKERKGKRQTRLFSLPVIPGTYAAKYVGTFKTKVLVTGADYNAETNTLVLCGYNLWLKPFLLEFEDFQPQNFASSKITRTKIKRCFTQIEGISLVNNVCYLISEQFNFLFIHRRQRIHEIKLQD